jgi:hypothetical protein
VGRHNLHSAPNIVRMIGGKCSTHSGDEKCIQTSFVGKPGRSKRRWKGIKMGVKEIAFESVDWVRLA